MAIQFGGETPYTLVTDSLVAHYDAADGSSYPGSGSTWYDISGNDYDLTLSATNLWVDSGSMSYMNFEGGVAKYLPGGTLTNIPGTDTNNCTIVMFSTIKAADNDWKTLIRDTGAGLNHGVIVSSTDGVSLGMFDNNTSDGFQDTGFDVSTLANHTTQFHYMAWKLSETTSPYYEFFYDDDLDSAAASLTTTEAKYVGGTAIVGGYHNNSNDAGTFSQEWGKINVFLFYNKHLSTAELTQNYNYLNSRYGGPSGESTPISNVYIGNNELSKIYRGQNEIYSKIPSIIENGLILHLDVNNPSSYPGTGTTWTDLTGNGYNHTLFNGAGLTTIGGISCLDCTGNNYIADAGTTFAYGNNHTMIAWVYTLTDAQVSTWRTLWRTTPDDHPLLIQDGTDIIGYYDNNSAGFVSYGLTAAGTGIAGNWAMVSLVGTNGTSTSLYINEGTTNGTVGHNTTGNSQDAIGSTNGGSQPYGYISAIYVYNRSLSSSEIEQQYNATKGTYGL